ncbi:helix-turn-helix domain-containing protein [Burkholderia gladioli]|uniref:helix-turn-helix domain-containing protein n=1 Tax=Burkholderia gladioli TaxID=28095 RepID=UPI001E388D4D|nr:helix-turn-helix domain-containing protein [Burkholderia gladioli]
MQFGRRPTLTVGQIEHARELLADGRTASDTAKLLKVHRATLYRALRGQESS